MVHHRGSFGLPKEPGEAVMFRVRWARQALNELAQAWAGADAATRKEITSASHAIDQQLSADPFHTGESRSPGRRIAFFPPLVVTFRVEAVRQTVSVSLIRLFGKRRS